ncbi:hypothetical protein GQ457_16G013200 [Hibiscus cannabinus]
MENFKIYDFAHNLKPNKFNFHSNVVAALEGTCFENVIKATEVSRHCYPFLQALLRRYNRRVKCFEFGVNNSIRLFITLGDVLRITGLPIDGRAVIVDESSIDLKRLCSKYLGSEQLLHHGDINLPKLQSSFGNFQPGGTVKELKYHVRAYILYIIGSVLAHSPSSSVPALYLQLLRKVERIGQYAWGAAMLAHLYYHLDTMEESKYCVSGNFHLLSVSRKIFLVVFLSLFRVLNFYLFIVDVYFERIPWIVSQLLHPRGPIILPEEVNDRPREFPLMVEWHSKMAMALKNSRSGLKESTFTDFFDQLSEDDVSLNFFKPFKLLSYLIFKHVELNPYARLEEDFLPPPYNHQIALERCLTSIICVEKRVLYDPGVLVTWRPRNSGPFGDRKKELKKYHSKRIRKRTGHRRNWLKKNEMNIQAWKDSRNYLYDAGVIPGTSPTLFQEDVGDDEHQDYADDIPRNLSPQVQIDEGGGGLQQDDVYDADDISGVLPLQEEDVSTYAEEDVEDDEHGHAVLEHVPATPPAQNTPPAQEPDRAGASTQRPQELLTYVRRKKGAKRKMETLDLQKKLIRNGIDSRNQIKTGIKRRRQENKRYCC